LIEIAAEGIEQILFAAIFFEIIMPSLRKTKDNLSEQKIDHQKNTSLLSIRFSKIISNFKRFCGLKYFPYPIFNKIETFY